LGGCKYILVAIDYFTKWMEVAAYAELKSSHVARFIEQHILCRYGVLWTRGKWPTRIGKKIPWTRESRPTWVGKRMGLKTKRKGVATLFFKGNKENPKKQFCFRKTKE